MRAHTATALPEGPMYRFQRGVRLTVVGGFTLLLAALSTVPGVAASDDSGFVWTVAVTPKLLQKSMHVVLYGMLTAAWAWMLDGRASTRCAIAAAALIAIGFGAAMEVWQTNVPGRYGTLLDVLLNTLGVLAGVAILSIREARQRARERPQ